MTPKQTISATPAVSVTATPSMVRPVAEFSLDAVRVSTRNNPGNLQGLADVKRGAKVWLMMYYTIGGLTHKVTRTTTYAIYFHGRIVFRVTYRTGQKASERGRFSRYTIYTVPASSAYGQYIFHATLILGSVKHTKSWKFQVAAFNRVGRLRSNHSM